MLMTVQVFQCGSVAQYLGEVYRSRKNIDAEFSLRSFTKSLNIADSGLLSRVLRGARRLTPAQIETISQSLNLNETESYYFLCLAMREASETPRQKEMYERFLVLIQKGLLQNPGTLN